MIVVGSSPLSASSMKRKDAPQIAPRVKRSGRYPRVTP
jgi:hypothetical protein